MSRLQRPQFCQSRSLKTLHERFKWTWKWCHPLEILGNWCVRESCWCAAALGSLTHGHTVGGIIHYMEKTTGFHVTRNGTPTMCAVSWRASPVLLVVLTNAPWEMHGLGYTWKNLTWLKWHVGPPLPGRAVEFRGAQCLVQGQGGGC